MRFYCPAFVRNPDTSRGPACMAVLPCEEHGIKDRNQGHRQYGQVISDVPEGVSFDCDPDHPHSVGD